MSDAHEIAPADLLALQDEWEAVFNGETMPWGFEVGPEQVPILRECIRKRSRRPLDAFVRSLPKDRVY